MSLLALLPSPLLGSAVWEPVAAELGELGRSALAVPAGGCAPASAQEALRAFLAGLPEDDALVLVPHSNAGAYVPAITAHRSVSAAVFVDARLPAPGAVTAPLAPAESLPMLSAMADEQGFLPVWTRWWDASQVEALLPDAEIRARIEREQRRLPLSYFQDAAPVPAGWADLPCAYLAFGSTYAGEVAQARDAGWPVEVLDGQHLEMAVHPRLVAERILHLLNASGSSSR